MIYETVDFRGLFVACLYRDDGAEGDDFGGGGVRFRFFEGVEGVGGEDEPASGLGGRYFRQLLMKRDYF